MSEQLCIKCDEELKQIISFELLTTRFQYCDNKQCDRFGLLTVAVKELNIDKE